MKTYYNSPMIDALPQAFRFNDQRGRPVVKPRGFALIATISVMVLLVMIALAMLSLSTITLRSVRHDTHMQEAQANARLALMLAIGELQASAGPDQRVTATGSLWATPAAGTEHLVGVWNSEDADNDGEPDGDFVRWLVSRADSDEVENIGMVNTAMPISQSGGDYTAGDGYEILVGGGSVAQDTLFPDVMQGVVAEKVNLLDDQGAKVGRYAWWVGDEGVKARVNQLNEQTDPDLASQTMQRAAIESITDFDTVNGADLALNKVVGLPSLGLVTGVDPDPLLSRFHDMSTYSLGLQTNTRDGGLKTDLSLLFEMSDADFEALEPGFTYPGDVGYDPDDSGYAVYVNEDTPISSTGTERKGLLFYDDGVNAVATAGNGVYGPTIDLLRNHYRQYKSITGTSANPEIVAQASMPNKTDFGGDGEWPRTASVLAWRYGLNSDPSTDERLKLQYWDNSGDKNYPTPRLLRGNVTPYLNRVLLYFNAQAEEDTAETALGANDQTYKITKFTLQPIFYVHNPYNVRMSVERMRYVRKIQKSKIKVMKDDVLATATSPNPDYDPSDPDSDEFITTSSIDFGEIMKDNGARFQVCSSQTPSEAQFVVSTPTTFAPGEVKIFVLDGAQELGGAVNMVELSNSFAPGAVTLNVDSSSMTTEELELVSNIAFGTRIKMNIEWTTYYQEHFEIDSGDGFNTVWSAVAQNRYQNSTGRRNSGNGIWIGHATENNVEDLMTSTPITVEDRFLKPLQFLRHEAGATTPTVGYPSFVLSNPLTSSESNAFGVKGDTTTPPGRGIYASSMYQGHLDFAKPSYPYLSEILNDDTYGTWGSNNGVVGERNSIVLEIPTAPLFSPGALQHANIAVEGYHPALAIGNSFPNLTMTDYSLVTEQMGGQLNYDLSYMANRALWDRYFFSSITPQPSDGSYSSLTQDPQPDLDLVIGDFVDGTGTLGNPRMVLGAQGGSRVETVTTLNDYRKNAAILGMKGAFNINSTSVEAWKAVLSGYRNAAMRVGSGTEADAATSALPRLTRSLISAKEDPSTSDAETWQSYAKLDDDKIEDLASAIVVAIKSRATARFGGGPVTPALTLGQFVNRTTTGTTELTDEMQQRGILQAAIEASSINGDLGSTFFNASTHGNVIENKPFVGDGLTVTLPVALSAPASVLQSDILQAIGASISARSDTFRIRTYGESLNAAGDVVAKVWAESIVQRTTRPVNPDSSNEWEPDLTQIPNFGRRFKMISFRWLNKNEI